MHTVTIRPVHYMDMYDFEHPKVDAVYTFPCYVDLTTRIPALLALLQGICHISSSLRCPSSWQDVTSGSAFFP
jgi:hypothetical protein